MMRKETKKQIMLLVEEYGFQIFVSCRIPRIYEMNVEEVNNYNKEQSDFNLKASRGYNLVSDDYDLEFEDVNEIEFDYSGEYNGVDYSNSGLSENQLFKELSGIFKEINVMKVAQLSDNDLLSEYEYQARKMAMLEAEKVKRESDPTKTKVGTIHSAKDYFLKQYDQVSCEELHVISLDQMDHVIKDDCVTIGDNDEIERIAAEVVKKATLSNAAYVYVVNIQKTASTQTLKKNVEIATKINERLKILDGLMADYAVMVGKDYLSYRMKEIDKAINKEEKNENSRYR